MTIAARIVSGIVSGIILAVIRIYMQVLIELIERDLQGCSIYTSDFYLNSPYYSCSLVTVFISVLDCSYIYDTFVLPFLYCRL